MLGPTLLAAAAALASAAFASTPDTLLTFHLALSLEASGLAALQEAHAGVSTPGHARWGQHLSREAADALVRPAAAQQAAVLARLAATCAASAALTPGGDWVEVAASAACATSLFGVPIEQYAAASGGRVLHRCVGRPRVPAGLEAAVAAVAPCRRAPRAGPALSTASGAPSTTPAIIRAQYQLGSHEASGAGGGIQVAGFLDEFAEDADLQQFFDAYYKPARGRHFAVVGPNGRVSGVEAALDVQYVMSVGGNLSTTFWYTDAGPGPNPNDNEPYLLWLLNVTALPDASLPHTVSVSYSDDEDTIDPAYAAAVEVLQVKLGARGVSMLHASGDGGVAGAQGGACLDGNKRFRPTWPASSQFITSVGSTDTTFARASGFSAGGFSNLHAPAAYQAAAVAAYLKRGSAGGLPPASYFNASGRGIPDVAAVGENFMIVSSGRALAVDGTSCSTPTFAGIVGLANDARVAAGKRGLGFLNHILYAHPELFTDIAAGSNPGCGTSGFPAVAGWDPVTGLGAPIWPALLKLAMQLP